MEKIFIVGCGYVGTYLAQQALAHNQIVLALTHSQPNTLQRYGVQTVQGDLDIPESLTQLPTENSILYYFAPPPSSGHQDSRLQHFLHALTHLPQKIVLISTTGVYGDCQGAWIDESQPLNPQTDRARRRVDSENSLQAWAKSHSIDTAILRVPGIYGAERLPLQRIQQGAPVLDAASAPYSNRIHVKDLVAACIAAGEKEHTGIYNVSDGHPTTMTDYFNKVAEMFNLPLPPTVDWATAQQTMSPAMLSFLTESKRISHQKMREVLGVTPQFPNLATGLADCLNTIENCRIDQK